MKSVIVVLVVSVLSLSLLQRAYGFSGSGSGTEEDPYIITNVDQLQEMQCGLNAWYKLANDVNASETVNWNGGAGFIPVGDSTHGFAGHLNGKGLTISGLYINRGGTDMVGLFGKLDGATVENVTLTDPNIASRNQVGGLVGYSNNSSITNCRSIRAMVFGNENVGGLVGSKEGGTIVGCSSHQPTVSTTGSQCAGLVGQCGGTTIIDCQCAEADISGTSNVGGLVGAMGGSISDSSVDASVNATGDNCGGLAGSAGGGNITNCHSVGIVVGRSYVGGLIGTKSGDIVSNCSSQATSTATGDNCGGLMGGVSGVNITSCHSSGWVAGNNNVGGLVGIGGCWWGSAISHCYATGNVEGYQRVGGLVGSVCSGSNITNSYSTGGANGNSIIGGFVGYNESSSIISRCFSTADANSSDVDCGGFVGINAASITDCFATGSATGREFIGGFVGETTTGATTANCYSAGKVGGTCEVGTCNFGGFAGYNSGTCSACFWDVNTSGVGVSGCGTGKITVQMMQQATFDPPWNFATIWGMGFREHLMYHPTYPYPMELSPHCGDPWHPYPIGDLNYDCRVDFYDFSEFASNWLECTDPNCLDRVWKM